MKTITLIPGDGIGPEITSAVKFIFEQIQAPVEWEEYPAGETALQQTGELIPHALIDSLHRNRVALKGPVATPVGKGFRSVNVTLRQMFDLYANVRPCQTTPGLPSKFDKVDIVIFRENTEGLYSGLSYYDERFEIADSISRISRKGCMRIVKSAFDYAQKNGRKKVTVVHKANILKVSGALMLEAAKVVAEEYPGIEWDDKIIDNMAMQLVLRPEQFDVIVTSNLFGDILSDLCAGLVGGLGVVAGANIGNELAIFEAVHGTAPDIAGRGIANPTALLRSAVMLLQHIGQSQLAQQLSQAINHTLAQPQLRTADLGGPATTMQFAKHVVEQMAYIQLGN